MIAVAAACTSAVQGYTTAGERLNCHLPYTGFHLIWIPVMAAVFLLLGTVLYFIQQRMEKRSLG